MTPRRHFVHHTLATTAVLGCGGPPRRRDATSVAPPDTTEPDPRQPAGSRCQRSEPNIEGPFFREHSPDISGADGTPAGLVRGAHAGIGLQITGRVLGVSCEPLPGARIEVWQANEHGDYDNVGQHLRGHFRSDGAGNFALWTIVPGHYQVQGGFRPAHVHVKVLASGRPPLTTQLYFAGDPYNDDDPFIRPSLIMPVTTTDAGIQCQHQFVI